MPEQPKKTMSSANEIAQKIIKHIQELHDEEKKSGSLKYYEAPDLVRHSEEFGPSLKRERLETNQVRKFLDALNRLKVRLAQDDDEEIKQAKSKAEKEKLRFDKIKSDVYLLKPKLAYAAARQKSAKPLGDVMSAAIDKVKSSEDFERLVQLIESIIAYHKAEGGK